MKLVAPTGIHPGLRVPAHAEHHALRPYAHCEPSRRRTTWLGLLVTMTLLISAANSRAIDIKALVGFGQSVASSARYRADSWIPLTVYLSGQGDTGVAQLQVTVKTGQYATVYTRRVPLHEGPLNEVANFSFLLRTPDATAMFRGAGNGGTDITIQLLKDGRKLADKIVSLPTPTNAETYNVLGLTRDGSGLNFLLKKKLGLVHKQVNPSELDNHNPYNAYNNNNSTTNGKKSPINPLASLQVLYTDPRALPSQGQGYDMIDAIALGDQPLDSLTEDQVSALKDFVRMGGLLIVSGGGDLARLKSQFYIDMLPIQPETAIAAHTVPDLETRYREPLGLPDSTLLTDGTLKPGAVALFGRSAGKAPLISAIPYGNGRVVFTAFDALAPEFRGWKGGPALWRDLLRSGNNAISACAVAQTNARFATAQPTLEDALAGKQATNAPGFWTIAIFVCLYLLLLIPISYFILKRMDKRELAWFTQPLLILAFTVASYMIALSIKGNLLTVNRAAILETQANSPVANGYAEMTLYSPQRAEYDITIGSPDDPNSAYRTLVPSEIYMPQNSNIGAQLTIDQDKTTILRQTLIKLWDKRSFDTPINLPLGGTVDVATKTMDRGHVEVTITNKTRFALTDCGLASQDDSLNIGDLAPGATVQKTMKWTPHGSTVSLALPTAQSAAQTTAPPTRESLESPQVQRSNLQSGLLQAASSAHAINNYWNQNTGQYGQATGVFVGWFYDPVVDVRVNGKPAAGEEANMLCVHLPTPSNASPLDQAATNPFVLQPYLELEDDQPAGVRRTGIFQ